MAAHMSEGMGQPAPEVVILRGSAAEVHCTCHASGMVPGKMHFWAPFPPFFPFPPFRALRAIPTGVDE